MSQVVILSGPSGAGKSAVAEALCERYDRTVHLETDDVFAWIRMVFVDPMRPESDRQNRLVARAAARAAGAFAQDLYAVFIDGVIGPHLLPIYLEELRPAGVTVQFAILLPNFETALGRAEGRLASRIMRPDAQRRLHEQFVAYGAFAGVVIDTSAMTAQQAADAVMAACGEGRCIVRAGGSGAQ